MDFTQQRAQKVEFFRDQARQFDFTREYGKAVAFLLRAGLLGDEASIKEVCYKIKTGYGMTSNFDELYRCMLVGAKKGIADAMYELGVCYSCGLGTDKDEAEAMHWFSEGAKAGSREAAKSLRAYNYDFMTEEYDELNPFALTVRTTVFVEEQGFEDEFDDIDARAHHFVVFDGSHPVATCRVFWNPEMNSFVLGRLVVIKDYRGLSLGTDLVEAAINYVKDKKGKSLALHSQLQAKSFYERCGFVSEQAPDEEQGCPHVWMYRRFF